MKKWFNYLFIISLIFITITLYKSNYLVIPQIVSFPKLLFSIILLFIGFLLDVKAWQEILRSNSVITKYSSCLASMGLSVFWKYIPGKIWVIAGRSSYIAKKYNGSDKQLVSISLNAQLIGFWMGIIFGGIGLLLIKDYSYFGLLFIGCWIFFTIVLFTKYPSHIVDYLLAKIFKSKFKIPFLSFKQSIGVIFWYFLTWVTFSVSFYLLCQSMLIGETPISASFGFAFANTIGLLVIFVPGGLGVREGMLFGFLLLVGLTEVSSSTISVSSRLWFLLGEFFVFAIGIFVHFINSRKNHESKA
jgi:glycosyltransferase 2 family protein